MITLLTSVLNAPVYNQPFSAPGPPGPMQGVAPSYNGYPQPYGHPLPPFQAPTAYGSPPAPYSQQPFVPPQPYQSPNSAYAPPSQYQTGQAHPIVPPRAFGANSPPVPFQVSPPPPPQSMSQPQRPNSLPPAPGLPQRPAFGAPPVNHFQMQQMHQGQHPGQRSLSFSETPTQNGNQASTSANGTPVQSTTVVSTNDTPQPTQEAKENKAETKPAEGTTEKKSKKDKDKEVKLVYSDNEVSPEEKLAKLARYAFDPKDREETVLGQPTAAVTGTVSGSDGITRPSYRGPGRDNA
jgi:hypothetical protein